MRSTEVIGTKEEEVACVAASFFVCLHFAKPTYKNTDMSKIVVIKRREIDTQLPKDIMQSGKMRMGSFWQNGSVATGLNRTEIRTLMPELVNAEPDDKNFRTEVRQYFANLEIEVTPGGTKLEIGLDETKMPINVLDYIKWKIALIHPSCNGPKGQRPNARFYIEDPEAVKVERAAVFQNKMAAYQAYQTIQMRPKIVRQVLIALGVKMGGIKEEHYDLEVQTIIENGRANEVVKAVNNPMLAVIAAVKEGLAIGLLTEINGSIFLEDTPLGNSTEKAALYLKAPENADVRKTFLARLKTSSRVVT